MSNTAGRKFSEMSDEQLKEIAGGSCTISDIQDALAQLQQSYDTLVDFTSYVIGRVAGEPPQ
jgi:bacteriocin-like protein